MSQLFMLAHTSQASTTEPTLHCITLDLMCHLFTCHLQSTLFMLDQWDHQYMLPHHQLFTINLQSFIINPMLLDMLSITISDITSVLGVIMVVMMVLVTDGEDTVDTEASVVTVAATAVMAVLAVLAMVATEDTVESVAESVAESVVVTVVVTVAAMAATVAAMVVTD